MMCGEISGLGKRLPLENSRFEGVLPKTPVLQRGSGEAPGPSGSPTYEVMKCSYRRGNSSAKNGIAEGNNPALSHCSREGKCPSGTCNRRNSLAGPTTSSSHSAHTCVASTGAPVPDLVSVLQKGGGSVVENAEENNAQEPGICF